MTGRRALIAITLIALLGAGLAYFLRKRVSELPVYTTGGARMVAGDEIYRTDDLKPFTYPPFFAVPFVPLAALPESAHRVVWYFTNVAALIAIVVLLIRAVRPQLVAARGPPVWLFWVTVGLLAGRHVSAVFENQSHDLLVFAAIMLGLSLSLRHRDLGCGAWLGAAAACKATPLLFLPILVLQRRLAAVTGLLGVAIAATLLPDLVFPRTDGQLWVVAWAQTFLTSLSAGRPAEAEGAWSAWNLLNQNLAGSLYRLSTPIVPGEHSFDVSVWDPGATVLRYVTLAAQGAVLGFLAWVARPSLSRGLAADEVAWRRVGEAGAIVCGMVLLSPMSSKSHFCVLLLPVAFCVAEVFYRRRSAVVVALLAVAFFSGTLTTRGLLGRELGRELLARGSVTACTLAILVATGVVLLRARRDVAVVDQGTGPDCS